MLDQIIRELSMVHPDRALTVIQLADRLRMPFGFISDVCRVLVHNGDLVLTTTGRVALPCPEYDADDDGHLDRQGHVAESKIFTSEVANPEVGGIVKS